MASQVINGGIVVTVMHIAMDKAVVLALLLNLWLSSVVITTVVIYNRRFNNSVEANFTMSDNRDEVDFKLNIHVPRKLYSAQSALRQASMC